jgi:ferredoxin--NADP+ reductase
MGVYKEGKFVTARVADRRDYTEDLWTVRLEHEADFDFVPGQYATLGIRQGDQVLERPYSLVSAPGDSELEFLLELVPGPGLTPHLHRLNAGDELLMRPRAKGRFYLDLAGGRTHHLMVATVTGVAPFVSMLRQLKREDTGEGLQVLLVHGASRSVELGYDSELEELAAGNDWFTYVPTISRPWEDGDWPGELGRVEDVLRKYADQCGITPENGIVYLCGHPEMIVTGEQIMKRRGLDPAMVRQEEYWPLGKEAPEALEEPAAS